MTKKCNPLVSFLIIYCLLICGSYLLTFLLSVFDLNASSLTVRLLFAVGQASLTSFDSITIRPNFSFAFVVFSPALTQLSGIVFLSFLLWFYWQLFSDRNTTGSIKDAFKLTTKISLIIVAGLFLFFLYAHPSTAEAISFTDKFLASLSLAVGSFNNAGFLNSAAFTHSETLLGDSIIQLGIIAGTVMGNLGIFVIDELLNPKHLRDRMEHPDKDWSMATKLVVFGTAILIFSLSLLHWLVEYSDKFAELNIMESLIASFYEISTSRGFGFSVDASEGPVSILPILGSIFAAGPFSTGGGSTLLSFVFAAGILFPGRIKQRDLHIAFHISRRLIIFTLVSMLMLFFFWMLVRQDQPFSALLFDQWNAFSCNNLKCPGDLSWAKAIILSLTNILGRIGFIIACYLTLLKFRT